jgi:hypothetical protein
MRVDWGSAIGWSHLLQQLAILSAVRPTLAALN